MEINNAVSSSPAVQAPTPEHQMTTTELIAQLQQIEASHGVLPIHMETSTTIDLMDIYGNRVETFSTAVATCETGDLHDGCNSGRCNTTKVVWLIGQVIVAEQIPDDDDEIYNDEDLAADCDAASGKW